MFFLQAFPSLPGRRPRLGAVAADRGEAGGADLLAHLDQDPGVEAEAAARREHQFQRRDAAVLTAGTARVRVSCPATSPLSPSRPYSPELNPVENVWQYLPVNWLPIGVLDDYSAIVVACCRAWNHFASRPDTVSSITLRQRAQG
jgi:hypothetical protein